MVIDKNELISIMHRWNNRMEFLYTVLLVLVLSSNSVQGQADCCWKFVLNSIIMHPVLLMSGLLLLILSVEVLWDISRIRSEKPISCSCPSWPLLALSLELEDPFSLTGLLQFVACPIWALELTPSIQSSELWSSRLWWLCSSWFDPFGSFNDWSQFSCSDVQAEQGKERGLKVGWGFVSLLNALPASEFQSFKKISEGGLALELAWLAFNILEEEEEERRASASSLAISNWDMCLMWELWGHPSDVGACVEGSSPTLTSFFFRCVFQKFLTSLSVLPGNCAAIEDHL